MRLVLDFRQRQNGPIGARRHCIVDITYNHSDRKLSNVFDAVIHVHSNVIWFSRECTTLGGGKVELVAPLVVANETAFAERVRFLSCWKDELLAGVEPERVRRVRINVERLG